MSQALLPALEADFVQLADLLFSHLDPGEYLSLALESEQSQFIRFNRAKVRQTGTVVDGTLQLRLFCNQRTASAAFPFTSDRTVDRARGLENLSYLRQELPQLPKDPFIILPENHGATREIYPGELLPPAQAAAAILPAVEGIDFTGVYAAGTIIRAHANSAGERHWFATDAFCLDYSMISPAEKAVKDVFAGSDWNQKHYQDHIQQSKQQLAILETPAQAIPPGRYRTYLAPAATAELVDMLSWGAVSEAALRQGDSALGKLRQGKTLSAQLNLSENFSRGVVPRFNQLGEVTPEQVPLIVAGRLVNTLVSSRTAKEYKVSSNSANGPESLRAPELSPGSLAAQEILLALGTGLYLSNLHYLNWSDRPGGRITGMTRHACFWVENGKIIAPIKDLRFDETLYAFWGDNLEALTDFQEFIPNTDTYNSRKLGGFLVPGMLVRDFTFTL